MTQPRRVVVGITGATGAVYAVRLLARLKATGHETHLVASPAGVPHGQEFFAPSETVKRLCRLFWPGFASGADYERLWRYMERSGRRHREPPDRGGPDGPEWDVANVAGQSCR